MASQPPLIVDPSTFADVDLDDIRPNKIWYSKNEIAQRYPTSDRELPAREREAAWRRTAQVQAFRELYERRMKENPPLMWEQAYAIYIERQQEIFDTLRAQWIVENGTP